MHIAASDPLAALCGEPTHPGGERGTGPGQRVVVHALRVLLVARVGVPAATVGGTGGNGHVVVAGHARAAEEVAGRVPDRVYPLMVW